MDAVLRKAFGAMQVDRHENIIFESNTISEISPEWYSVRWSSEMVFKDWLSEVLSAMVFTGLYSVRWYSRMVVENCIQRRVFSAIVFKGWY